MTRGWGLVWGGVLVVIGALALLFNLGLVHPEQLDRLVVLWPLILMLIGAEIVISRLASRTIATITMSVVVLLVVAGSVGYVATAPPVQLVHRSVNVADAGSEPATLKIELGASTVRMDSAPGPGDAARIGIDYSSAAAAPTVHWNASSRVLAISRSTSALAFGLWTPDRVTVTLSEALPWSLELDTGASTITGDLGQLQLKRLTVDGGALTLHLQVGQPSSSVALEVDGGANHVDVTRPAGVAIHVEVDGGLNSLQADGHGVGNAVGAIAWSSSGYPAADAYRLRVDGGANQVTVSQTA